MAHGLAGVTSWQPAFARVVDLHIAYAQRKVLPEARFVFEVCG